MVLRARLAVSRTGPAVVAMVALVAGGCLIDRGPIGGHSRLDSGREPLDSGAFDAPIPPGLDAPMVDPDAVVVMEPDAAMVEPDANLCDSVGDPCCGGGSCMASLVCLNDGRCGTNCGDPGFPCCYTGFCRGTAACGVAGSCEPCGGTGQLCCAGSTCTAGTDTCAGDHCIACGGLGQACCAGGCRAGSCGGDGVCRAPEGMRGGACIDGWRCAAWAQCRDGTCIGCGMRGEDCCGLGDCQSGLSCRLLSGFDCG